MTPEELYEMILDLQSKVDLILRLLERESGENTVAVSPAPPIDLT